MLRKVLLFTTMSALLASSALAQDAGNRGGSTTSGVSPAPEPGSPESAEMRQVQQTLREIQQALKDTGHDPGEIDGVMGPKTKAAVRSFQQAEGLSVTGFIDGETLARRAEAAAASARVDSRPGASGRTEPHRTDPGSRSTGPADSPTTGSTESTPSPGAGTGR